MKTVKKPKKKAFADMQEGTLVEETRPVQIKPGEVRVTICYADDDILILKGKIKKNYDLVDLAEISEETI